jgi:hypothetical protein
MLRIPVAGVLFGFLGAMLPGCSGSKGAADRPNTVSVTGTVTYKGQAVAGATVAFVPDFPVQDAAKGHGAFGKTDAEGKFTLRTFEAGDGAVPGKYLVTITKYEGSVSPVDPNFNEETDYVPPDESSTAKTEGPKNALPVKYAQTTTSKLKAEVTESGANDFEFKLND